MRRYAAVFDKDTGKTAVMFKDEHDSCWYVRVWIDNRDDAEEFAGALDAQEARNGD